MKSLNFSLFLLIHWMMKSAQFSQMWHVDVALHGFSLRSTHHHLRQTFWHATICFSMKKKKTFERTCAVCGFVNRVSASATFNRWKLMRNNWNQRIRKIVQKTRKYNHSYPFCMNWRTIGSFLVHTFSFSDGCF